MTSRWGLTFSFGLVFLLYLFTACPTVYVGDAGELIAAAYSLGVAHPPGYPVFAVIGKMVSVLLPLGNIAFRLNLSTAIGAAAAAALIGWLICQIWREARGWPWVLAVAFGVSKTFWSQSTQAEVYALHMVLVIGFLGYAWKGWEIIRLRSWQADPWKTIWVVSLLFGIGLGHHHTMLLLGVVWAALLYAAIRRHTAPVMAWTTLAAGSLVGLGVCLYFVLQIRALADPSMNWGDPETFSGLSTHLLRKQYGTLSKQPRSWELMWEQWHLYWKSLTAQWGWWMLLPSAIGLGGLVRSNRRLAGWAMTIWGLYSVGMVLLLNYKVTPQYEDIMKVFFIPSYLTVIVGWAAVLNRLAGVWRAPGYAAAVLCGVVMPFVLHRQENNLGRHFTGYFYGRAILELPLTPSYMFVAQDNEVFTTAYLQKVEGWRPSLTVYDELGCVFDNIYGEYFLAIGKTAHQQRLKKIQRELLEATDRPIYYVLASGYRRFEDMKDVQQGLVFTAHPRGRPEGVPKGTHQDQIPPRGSPREGAQRASQGGVGLTSQEVSPWRRMNTSALWQSPEHAEYLVRDLLAQYHLLIADWHRHRKEEDLTVKSFRRASEVGQTVDWVQSNVGSALMKEGHLSEAIVEYERGIALNPRKASAYYDLAIAYNKAARVEDAIRLYRQALEVDPRYASARNNLGNIFLRQGKFEESIREYRAGVEADPENVQAVFNLGGALEELKRYDEAKMCYEQALTKNPKYVEAMNNLAGVYLTKGEVGQAVEWYQKALAINPEYVDSRYNLGFAYFLAAQQLGKQGQSSEARRWVEQAMREWRLVLQAQPGHLLSKDRLRDAERLLSGPLK